MINPSHNQDGVSPTIKIFVIGLTVITFMAFCIFMYVLVTKFFSFSQSATWDKQLIEVGDRLKQEGFREEAITQYEKFLEGKKINPSIRAEVSYSIGKLYQEKGNCRQALAWFFQVEVAHQETARKKNIRSEITNCLIEVKNSKLNNLE